MLRERREVARATAECRSCGQRQLLVLYESWQPVGLLRRHTDVRWRWSCTACGWRVPATDAEVTAARAASRRRAAG